MYTVDWFDPNIILWARLFGRFRDFPTQSLEIGSFEGRSADWMLNSILIHPDSHMTCVDPHGYSYEKSITGVDSRTSTTYDMDVIHQNFMENMKVWFEKKKLTYHRESSPEFLKHLPFNHYDTIYIDGSHMASAVLSDGVICWILLKVGGVLLFDDYIWIDNVNDKEDPALWKPKLGIDAFLNVFHTRYKLIYQGRQVAIQKLS